MAGEDPLGTFKRWAALYGDIFYYRALNRHVYFLNHPDLIRQVLVADAGKFVKGAALRNNRRVFGNGLLTSEGTFWRQQRRLIQPAFRRENLISLGSATVAHAETMIASWHDGDAFDLYTEMMRVTLRIVTEELFRVEIGRERDRFARAVDALLRVSTGARLLLPAALRLIPTRGNLRYLRANRDLDEIVYGLIRRRRSEGTSGSAQGDDLLAVLLNARDETGAAMPDRQVRDEVMTMLLAGHETTAVALSWTWYLLARHPEVERQLWSELEQVLGGRSPRPDDLPRLPYTDAVIKEAIRLYPPIWAVVREPSQDCELGGYTVRAGSSVIMSQWVMHRDPRYFEHAEAFHPERWQEDGSRNLPRFAYFPFGGGPRVCIGASFATTEAMLILATVAQRFRVRLEPGFVAQPLPSITLRPIQGIQVTLERRPG